MNRVIHRELTAAELPESLRGDIDPSHRVRVVVEDIERGPSKRMLEAERILKLAGISKHKNTSTSEAVAKIRKIRNEWE
jgi:phosphosulfolactate synthase (CoM biosynthesis protein A)